MNWPKVQLGEILKEEKARVGSVDADGLALLGVSNTNGLHRSEKPRIADMSRYIRLNHRWFAYNPMRINVGSIGWAEHESQVGVISPDYVVFSCRGCVEPQLVYLFLRSAVGLRAINLETAGSVRERLYFDSLSRIKMPLPPLAEQRRLTEKVEELASKCHSAQALRSQTENEVSAVFSSLLRVVINPSGSGWKRETVADVVHSIDAGWSPQCEDFSATPGEWGVLKTTSVQWCEFEPHHNKALPPGLTPVPELAVKEGDVLVTRAGPRKRVGVIAMVRRDESQLTISDKLIRLRANRLKIDPRFLELSLSSPISQDHLFERKTGLADAQVNISQAILKATPIAYPSLIEQCRIVSRFDELKAELEALKRLQSKSTAELDALLPSIIDSAFAGRL